MPAEAGGHLGLIQVFWVTADFAGMQEYSWYFKIAKEEMGLFLKVKLHCCLYCSFVSRSLALSLYSLDLPEAPWLWFMVCCVGDINRPSYKPWSLSCVWGTVGPYPTSIRAVVTLCSLFPFPYTAVPDFPSPKNMRYTFEVKPFVKTQSCS